MSTYRVQLITPEANLLIQIPDAASPTDAVIQVFEGLRSQIAKAPKSHFARLFDEGFGSITARPEDGSFAFTDDTPPTPIGDLEDGEGFCPECAQCRPLFQTTRAGRPIRLCAHCLPALSDPDGRAAHAAGVRS